MIFDITNIKQPADTMIDTISVVFILLIYN